jgi:hypothetical protein
MEPLFARQRSSNWVYPRRRMSDINLAVNEQALFRATTIIICDTFRFDYFILSPKKLLIKDLSKCGDMRHHKIRLAHLI